MINRNILTKYLLKSLGELKHSHQGLKANCPKCDVGNKYNLEINIDGNMFNCWSCRYSGIIRKLMEDYAVDTSWFSLPEFRVEKIEHDEVEEKQLNYPTDTIPFYLHKPAYDYLVLERGLDKKELIRRGVSYVYSKEETYYNHLCFPFYEDGRLVGACLQNLGNKRYRNLGKLNFVPYKEFINTFYPIIITEGVYDAIPSPNGIPLLRTEINKEILNFIEGKDVILCTDNTLEIEQYSRLIKQINDAGCKSLVLFDMGEYKDMNEYYNEDTLKFYSEIKSCYKQIKS